MALPRRSLFFTAAMFVIACTVVSFGAVAAENATAAAAPGEAGVADASTDATAEGAAEATPADAGLVADEASAYSEHDEAYGDAGAGEAAPTTRMPARSHYEVGFSYQFDSAIDGGGNFHLWEAFVSGVYDVDLTDRFAIVTQFDYRADIYDFDDVPDVADPTPLVPPSPLYQWGVIHTPRIEPLAAFRAGDEWRIFVGPVFDLSFEAGANLREAFRVGGLVAAEWTINEDLRLGAGVIVAADIDSSVYASPVLLLDWNLSEDWALHMESWTTRGGEIEIDWQPVQQLELAISLGFTREYYRLAERTYDADPGNPPAPVDIHISNGLVRDRSYDAALRVSWLPRIGFVNDVFGDVRLDFDVAAALAGEFKIEDSGGATIAENDYDMAPSLGLTIHVPLPQ